MLDKIDATYLRPGADRIGDFNDAIAGQPFASICTHYAYSDMIVTESPISLVISFPYGNNTFMDKEGQLMESQAVNAKEIDFVLNPNYMNDSDYEQFENEVQMALEFDFSLVKFIVECRVVGEVGMEFVARNLMKAANGKTNFLVKNSTGIDWSGYPANSFARTSGDLFTFNVFAQANGIEYKYKAAGGISTPEEVNELLNYQEFKVERVGMGNVLKVLEALNG